MADPAAQSANTDPAQTEPAIDWRLFAPDDFVGSISGGGMVFGTRGIQAIRVFDAPGTIQFDPSFNVGGDVIRLEGAASAWTIARTGTSAILSDGDTIVTIPMSDATTAIVFDDGVRGLRFDFPTETFRIGEQVFTSQSAKVTAPVDDTPLPVDIDPTIAARVFVAEGRSVELDGTYSVFGTAGTEHVLMLDGSFTFDPSFNRGGDTLAFTRNAGEFTAVRQGSSVVLNSEGIEARIPIGTAGTTLAFADVDVVLRLDEATGKVLIGNQQIPSVPINPVVYDFG